MQCPKCHSDISNDSHFCTYCGEKIERIPSTVQQADSSLTPMSAKTTNKLAIGALICSAVPISAVVGFVLAIVAMFQIDANRNTQKGMNLVVIAGMLSVVWGILIVFGTAFFINEKIGGKLGEDLLKKLNSASSTEKLDYNILWLSPDEEAKKKYGDEELSELMNVSENIIRNNLRDAKIAKSVTTTNLGDIILVTLDGTKDLERAKKIMLNNSLPLHFRVTDMESPIPNLPFEKEELNAK